MPYHRLRRLGWRSLVQWRLHLGQCNEFLYDEIITAIAATFTPAAASRLVAAAAALQPRFAPSVGVEVAGGAQCRLQGLPPSHRRRPGGGGRLGPRLAQTGERVRLFGCW